MRAPNPLLQQLTAYESAMPASFRLSVVVPVYNERHVVEASLRRVLALEHALINSLEVIVVDDGSTDGTREILQRLADADGRITLLGHDTNQGKGAAIRSALACATGDIIIMHDADLEYNPADIPALLVPFAKEGADAVFGSRYLSAPYRRALMYRHTLINKMVTVLGNWLTDLTLTDLETCYKAINATLLQSIPLRSNDFRFEVEVVFKLAKRRARIFEAPIRYLPRTHSEGKKIRARDGLLALLAMLHFWVVDDLYKEDEYGSHILTVLDRARRFNLWMGETLRPYVGDRVLEIGAGIGNLTNQFIPRELYVASDINPNYLHYLRSYSAGKPYLRVLEIDADNPDHFHGLAQQFDTALMLNVLEHVPDEQKALRHLWSALEPGGRAIILVPQHPALYGTLDTALEHRARYTQAGLRQALTAAGFRIETVCDFNRFSAPGWWLNGKILRRKKFSRVQLKIIDTMMPILKRIDHLLPWSGISLIGIGVKAQQ
jgi:glycosyltransferase involved in cell wall biosynthesis